MQLQKQRKIKSSISRRDPGETLSPKLVNLFAILLLTFFFIYILAFHAVLHSSDEPVAVPVPIGEMHGNNRAAEAALTNENHQQHAAVHDDKKVQRALPMLDDMKERMKQVRERQDAETEKAAAARKETLVLITTEGDIKINLLPDLSKESVDYIRAMVADSGHCSPCNLYRAEKPGILQGVLSNKEIPIPTVKGTCPQGSEGVPNACPDWDQSCGCHGPVLTKGMVAWAAGATGPDFFISNYEKPALFWGTQHTACKAIFPAVRSVFIVSISCCLCLTIKFALAFILIRGRNCR